MIQSTLPQYDSYKKSDIEWIEQLPEGLFFLRVDSGKNTFQAKFVKGGRW